MILTLSAILISLITDNKNVRENKYSKVILLIPIVACCLLTNLSILDSSFNHIVQLVIILCVSVYKEKSSEKYIFLIIVALSLLPGFFNTAILAIIFFIFLSKKRSLLSRLVPVALLPMSYIGNDLYVPALYMMIIFNEIISAKDDNDDILKSILPVLLLFIIAPHKYILSRQWQFIFTIAAFLTPFFCLTMKNKKTVTCLIIMSVFSLSYGLKSLIVPTLVYILVLMTVKIMNETLIKFRKDTNTSLDVLFSEGLIFSPMVWLFLTYNFHVKTEIYFLLLIISILNLVYSKKRNFTKKGMLDFSIKLSIILISFSVFIPFSLTNSLIKASVNSNPLNSTINTFSLYMYLILIIIGLAFIYVSNKYSKLNEDLMFKLNFRNSSLFPSEILSYTKREEETLELGRSFIYKSSIELCEWLINNIQIIVWFISLILFIKLVGLL